MNLSPSGVPLKLDLGGGPNPREGFDSVDIHPSPTTKHVVNLMTFPWPFEDNSVDEIHSSHLVEHIPMLWVSPIGDVKLHAGSHRDKEMFFAFFDEVERILKPGAIATIHCPALQSVRAFQDPTHRRFIPSETFLYLNKKHREAMGVGHYNVRCDFHFEIDAIVPKVEGVVLEHEARRRTHWWNVVADWRVTLKKRK